MTLEKTCSVLAQERSPEFILQIMQTADRINMPKTLACCERHVAIDPAKSMRTQAFWEHIPARSSVRIATSLDAAYENIRAHFDSQMDSLNDVVLDITGENSRHGNAQQDAAHYVRSCKQYMCSSIKLTYVPPCKAFLQMAEYVLSQAKADALS